MTTTGLLTGLALAVAASLALNGSFLVQHLGAVGAPAISILRPLSSLAGLLRSRLWLAGTAAGLAGWMLHVGALSAAPLSLVQAFSAGGLALVVPVAARLTKSPLRRAERSAIALMVLALLALALGSAAAPLTHGIPLLAMLAFLTLAGATALALAATPGRRRRAQTLGAAAGVLYGVGDAATKAATTVAHAGVWAALASPWPALILLASVAAFFCFQRGLQIGPAIPVIVLMTAATNITAVLAGLAVFGEPLGASLMMATIHAVALVAVGLAAWWLAGAQARLAEPARAVPATVTKPPSAKARMCSTPARSVDSGITATKVAADPNPSQRTPGRRAVPASSAPAAPAQTHEIP